MTIISPEKLKGEDSIPVVVDADTVRKIMMSESLTDRGDNLGDREYQIGDVGIMLAGHDCQGERWAKGGVKVGDERKDRGVTLRAFPRRQCVF